MDVGGKSTPTGLPEETSAPNLNRTFFPPSAAIKKVVVDAGHGGKDPGGMGDNSQEKHIALKIAQLLAIGIRTNFPDVEVIMTRSDDTFIPLYERAAIANEEGADLFISIHANIMPGSKATYGTETFVMGQHVAKHNLAVAKRENAAILLEDNVQQNYGYDPNSDEGHIMMTMFQHAFLERSITFAELVESEFAGAGRKSRGVKQAGFVVLKETTMPSVLIETGFMSNLDEEAYLLSGVGQQQLANAILKAFSSYYKLLGGKGPTLANETVAASTVPTVPVGRPPVALPPAPSPASTPRRINVLEREVQTAPPATSPTQPPFTPANQPRQWTARSVSPQPLTYRPLPVPPPPGTVAAPATYGTPIPANQPASLPARSAASKTYESVLSREVTNSLQRQPTVYASASRASRPLAADTIPGPRPVFTDVGKQEATIDFSKIPDDQLSYAIQIIATKRILNLEEPRWKKIPYSVTLHQEGGWNKYQVRGLANAIDTKVARERIRNAGFTDAMIVVYYQGKRLGAGPTNYLLNRAVK